MSDAIFKAMADPTRRRILQVLSRAELGVSDLVEVLRLPQSTISRHLKVLREGGLVRVEQAGASTHYSLADQGLQEESGLADQMLAWIGKEPLPDAVEARVLDVQRRHGSSSDDFFGRIAHRWDRMRIDCFGNAFHLEALIDLLPSNWTVADVGTGTGYLLPLLSRTFEHVVAIDPVDAMLEIARSRAADLGLQNVAFETGSAARLPLPDESLDLCVASLVLHHEADPYRGLIELRRVLRPGGRLLVIEQESHSLSAFHDLMQDRWWGFDPAQLAVQMREAGFENVRTHRLFYAEPTDRGAPEAPPLFSMTSIAAPTTSVPIEGGAAEGVSGSTA